MSAPCACGCEQTRSTVGGGAARLGAVVPSTAIASLLEAPMPRAAGEPQSGFPEIFLTGDPIPI